jgi:peptidoglycan hydrolase-like protein with peptidoglycan-binding domain
MQKGLLEITNSICVFNKEIMSLQKSKTAKLFAGVTGVAVAFSLAVGMAIAPVSAMTAAEIAAQIAALQAQLSQLGGTSTTVSGAITKDLQMGMTDAQVKTLQQLLNAAGATVSTSGAGSPGNESMYFGAKTKSAVMKFQQMKGITPVAGYVGPKTRAALGGSTGGTVGTTPTTGSGLMVSASSQPSASLAPTSAARVPFTKVTLTASNDGDVTVNGITVERTGLAQDAAFAGVVLLDENNQQIGIARTLNSNHQVTVGDPFVIRAGQSKTVTIAGNMASSLSSYAGQVAVLSVVGVNTSATVNGSFPISGAMHTVNATLSLGTAQMNESSDDPDTSTTKEIGTTGYKVAGVRVQAGSTEKVRVWSIRWNQSGSASSNDLANVAVVVDGASYTPVLSADGKYYTATFGTGLVIDKGLSKDIYIKADIVGSGAAGRTIKFDLYKNTDIYITGETYGYGITPTAGTTGTASDSTSEFTTGTPFFDGSKVTVSAGSVTTISKANSVAAQNIAVNVPNQVLGGFETDVKGEAITVQQMVFTVATSSTGVGLLTNVSIYDQNGSVVAGPVDASGAGTSLTFTDSITLPIGKRVYTVKGKLPSTFTNNGTVVLSTNPSSQWTNITGQTTGNTISLSGNGSFSMNTMTVKGAALSIAVGSSPAAQTVVAGTKDFTMATYSLNGTQSGEDVRFSTIPLKLTYTGGPITNLSGCQLYDGTTALNTGSNVPTFSGSTASGADTTFTLDQSLVVPKQTSKSLTLKCNISSSATSSATYAWGIQATPSITVTGVTSSNDVTETVTASTGSTMTIGSTGSLAVSGINTSTYKVVSANTTGVELGRFNLRAENENVNVEKLGLTLTSGSSADLVNGQVTVWDGSTQVGTIDFTGATTATTSSMSLSVPKGTDKVLTIKADLSRIGTGEAGTPGRKIAIDYSSAEGKGASSGSTISGTGSTSFAGSRMQKSYPVITVTSTGGIQDNYTGNLVKVTIAADSKGDIVMNKLTFGVSSTTLVADRFEFHGPTGIVSSTTPVIMVSSSTARVYFDSTTNTDDRHIQAGTSKDFYLKGININLSGGTDTNKGSISVTLKGDTAYPTLPGSYLMSSTTPSGLSGQNTIWSPVSTTSANTIKDITVGPNYDDWTNGYGLQITCGGSTMTLGNDCSPVTNGNN